MKMKKRRLFLVLVVCALLVALPLASNAFAQQSVLDKVKRTGKIIIGHREGSVPFGFYDKEGEWVGFSIDIAERLVEELEKELGMKIEYVKKPINSESRIPFVVNRTIDIVMGSSTHTIPRDEIVDFSITYFLTGTRLLVPKESPIRDYEDLADRRVGAARGSTNERALRRANEEAVISPPAIIVEFDKHMEGFFALRQGKIDAYCTDGSHLAGLKQAAPNPQNWEIVGRLLTYDPYAFILPENDSNWRDFVNKVLIHLVNSGEFYQIYEEWMGPEGVAPIPMSEESKILLRLQCWPE